MTKKTQENINLLGETHPNFRFIVKLDKIAVGAFTECVLPTLEWEVEEVKEGGLNSYIHQLPGRRKSGRLTLKNGVGNKAIFAWLSNQLDQLEKESDTKSFERKEIAIDMLDMKQNRLMTWVIERAYPIKWTGPSLKTSDNAIAIESLELACGRVILEAAA